MPTTQPPEDVAAALARLEARPPGSPTLAGLPAGPVEGEASEGEPTTPHEAVRRWLASLGARPGGTQAPKLARLREAFEGYARSQGWGLDDVTMLGRVLRQLGYRVVVRGGARSPLLNRDAARMLWRGVPRVERPRGGAGPLPRRQQQPPRRAGPPFWDAVRDYRRSRARPLVDSMGRVWPSARVASSLLPRVNHQDIQACAKGRHTSVGGCLWRYLTPEEVASVPPMHLSGHVLPALAWRGTVAAHDATRPEACPSCGASLASPAAGPATTHPLPPGFPRPPGFAHAGGPTHIPAPNSEG